jgi:hypothetical protein
MFAHPLLERFQVRLIPPANEENSDPGNFWRLLRLNGKDKPKEQRIERKWNKLLTHESPSAFARS